jgi:hypothetical protein
MRPIARVPGTIFQGVLVFAGDVGVHGHGFAVDIRPAAGVRIGCVVVRITREVLALVGVKKLPEIDAAHALGAGVGLEDFPFVGDEAGQAMAAREYGVFVGIGAIDDGRGCRARVLRGKLQGGGEFVGASANIHRYRSRRPEAADLVASPGQCGEGGLQGAGSGIVAMDCDVERGVGDGGRSDNQREEEDSLHRSLQRTPGVSSHLPGFSGGPSGSR